MLTLLRADVLWANGMEGGHVQGREGVRAYWTRQWAMIDPHVEPLRIASGAGGEIIAEVHQTVRDPAGNLLSDKMVRHAFQVEDGLIRRFDIGAA